MHLLLVLSLLLQSVKVLFAFRDFPGNSSVSLSSQRLQKNKASVFADPFRNALSRKKRSFVFYKGTVVVLTDVSATALPGGVPRGLVVSNEIDIFYDVPLLVDGWRKPLEAFVEEYKAQKKEDEEAEKEDEELKNVGVVNASAIPLKEYNQLAYMRPTWSRYPLQLPSNRRTWEYNRKRYPTSSYRRPNYREGYNRYYYPNQQGRSYGQPMPITPTTPTTEFPSTPKEVVSQAYEETDRSLHAAKRSPQEYPQEWQRYRGYSQRRPYYEQYAGYESNPNPYRRNFAQVTTTTPEPVPATPKEWVQRAYDETDRSLHEMKRSVMENPKKWHHHREYRERRAFYDHLEAFGKMLGVSLRKCIQRAICEMKEQLLPEGESFINDIARILFTVPTEHDIHDEFTEIAREENVDCARRFIVSCPHSPLHYFQKNFRATGPTRPPTAEEALRSIIYA